MAWWSTTLAAALNYHSAKTHAVLRVPDFRIFVGIAARPKPIATPKGDGYQIMQCFGSDRDAMACLAARPAEGAELLECHRQKPFELGFVHLA